MAHDVAVYLDDPEWTERVALPLVRETAKGYLGIMHQEKDGYWHIHVKPSWGQESYGARNQRDYLCALMSAEYCLRLALEYGVDEAPEIRKRLRDGLAFPTLMSPQGIHYSNAEAGRQFGKQKHPIQIGPITEVPLRGVLLEAARKGYATRYKTTVAFTGWTGGVYLLAAARLGDVKGWREDWSKTDRRYHDPDHICIYETGSVKPFFTTNHGLWVQALLACMGTSWFGELEIGKCLPWNGSVRFGNIRDLSGITLAGELDNNGAGHVTLTALRDTAFRFLGEAIEMKKGETRRFELKGRKAE
jgi:hypothetical protein